MKRPWMQTYTRDWLDCKELRRCSPAARGILFDLMCLGNEGIPYGHLADKVGPLTVHYMASRCVVTNSVFLKCIAELMQHRRIEKTSGDVLFIPRMVEDEAERLRKSEAGGKGGNPKLVKRGVNGEVNHTHKQTSDISGEEQGKPPSRTRTRADCVSDSSVGFSEESAERNQIVPIGEQRDLFAEFCTAHPDKTNQDAIWQVWNSFDMGYWEQVKAVDCARRYAESAEVARSAIMRAPKWMAEQRQNNWSGQWVRAPTNAPGKQSLVEQVKEKWSKNIAEGRPPL